MDALGAQVLHQQNKLGEAEIAYRQVLHQDPHDADALQGLGMLLDGLGRTEDALELLARAIEYHPIRPDIKTNYAVVLGGFGRHAQALKVLEEALRLDPQSAAAHDNYGVALDKLHHLKDARSAFQRAVEIDPNYFEGLLHLGISLRHSGHSSEAFSLFERAKRLRPKDAEVLRQMAALAADRGDVQRLVGYYAQVLRTQSATEFDYSNLIFSMHYNPAISRKILFQGSTAWAGRFAKPLKDIAQAVRRDRDPARRLRIGYITSDFREHPAGRLLAPVLAGHDREQVQCFCYSDVAPGASDSLTVHLAGLADEWREIHGMPDGRVLEIIEQDKIDILVELNGHFGRHRLLLLARRAAPIQISAFGYCDTTGVSEVDYRITDARSDPPGSDDFHTEKLLRFEGSCWCYEPWDSTPDVQPPPSVASGYITFGNLNNPVKTTDLVAECWADILKMVPRSRLLLLTPRGATEIVAERFAKLGIARNRLLLVPPTPRAEYLELYHKVDVSLDPFPFNGDNTTCDAFWMGVPVVSLLGEAFWSRRGYSHLGCLGLEELVAKTRVEYETIAVNLAKNPTRLLDLRCQLRERVMGSPLGNRAGYVSKLEAAYRHIWTDWCKI